MDALDAAFLPKTPKAETLGEAKANRMAAMKDTLTMLTVMMMMMNNGMNV